jgi:hypothetical protein
VKGLKAIQASAPSKHAADGDIPDDGKVNTEPHTKRKQETMEGTDIKPKKRSR